VLLNEKEREKLEHVSNIPSHTEKEEKKIYDALPKHNQRNI